MRKPATIAILLALTLGCAHQRMEVSVELIQPVPPVVNTALQTGESGAITAIASTKQALFGQARFVDRVEAYLKDKIGEAAVDWVGARSKNSREQSGALADKGNALDLRIQAVPPEQRGQQDLVAEVSRYLQEASAFLSDDQAKWRRFVNELTVSDETRTQLMGQVDQRDSEKTVQVAAAAQALSGGFGGFRVEGVHTISPGDPLYPAVLQGKPIGAPISYVMADAAGDSSVMFVQETPTQLRVAEVETDSTQLVNNVVFITQKALAAAARYSGVPAAGAAAP